MKSISHRVESVERVSRHTVVVTLERHAVSFVPGHCFNLGLASLAINREYSIYSGIGDDHLQFLIREVEGGELSPRLAALKRGDVVEVDGGYGLFVLDPKILYQQKYIFVGTGTGVAPFHSFVRSYPEIDYLLIHGTRDVDEAYHRDHYAKDRYVHCVSQGGGGDLRGRVTDYLAECTLPDRALYYLCGNRHMINDVFDLLTRLGVSSSQIVTEVFF